MTQTVTLEVSEAQVLRLVQRLSPEARRKVLKVLVRRLDRLDSLVDYGEGRARAVAAQHGLDWDALGDAAREQLVDDLLHED